MRKLFLLLFIPIVCISGHSQSLEPDKYKFKHYYRCYVGENRLRDDYTLPRIPSYVEGDYRIRELNNKDPFCRNQWEDKSYKNYNVKPKNGYFFIDKNPFKDNDRVAIIQSGFNDNMSGKRTSLPYLSFIFTRSDKFPLKLKIDGNNMPYGLSDVDSKQIKIDLIFNGDRSTLMSIDSDYLKGKEIDPEDKIITLLKKYSFVDVRITHEPTEKERSRSSYTKVSLKGSTSALNKICGSILKPSKKNQFDYIYSMGLANFNPFNYEGYIYKFLVDAKKNHGLNFDYVKNRTVYTISKNLDNGVIAQSLTSNDDDSVMIQIDPQNWQNASQAKRWYIIYHELGHDILNLEHGECGPMMNAYAKPDYTWSEFEKDKITMFNLYKSLKGN